MEIWGVKNRRLCEEGHRPDVAIQEKEWNSPRSGAMTATVSFYGLSCNSKSFLCFLFVVSKPPNCRPREAEGRVGDPENFWIPAYAVNDRGEKICPLFFGIWYTLRLRTRKFLLKEGLSRLIPLAAGCSAARNILAVSPASDPFLYNRSVFLWPSGRSPKDGC